MKFFYEDYLTEMRCIQVDHQYMIFSFHDEFLTTQYLVKKSIIKAETTIDVSRVACTLSELPVPESNQDKSQIKKIKLFYVVNELPHEC